jgi:hypothetical protein
LAIILAVCLFTLLKMYHNGMNRHSSKCIICIATKYSSSY